MNLFVLTLVVSCLQITELTIHGQLRQSFIIRLKRLSLMLSIDVHALKPFETEPVSQQTKSRSS